MTKVVSARLAELTGNGVVGPLKRFADSETLARLRTFFETVVVERISHPMYGRFALRDWHLANPDLLKLLTAPDLVAELVAATGAESLILWRSKLFEKFPGGGPVEWHQEYGYFDGEEVGGHRPALFPLGARSPWCWTLWLPFTDVALDDGVMEFVLGSHRVRYATRMVPLTQSGAYGYLEPRQRIESKSELLARASSNSLILDCDTRRLFQGLDVDAATLMELFRIMEERLGERLAVATEPFTHAEEETQVFPMTAGQYLIFDQRTMHRSRPAGASAQLRVAISARYSLGTTLVYPQRRYDEALDGSGLDIREHRCVRVYGSEFCAHNSYW